MSKGYKVIIDNGIPDDEVVIENSRGVMVHKIIGLNTLSDIKAKKKVDTVLNDITKFLNKSRREGK